MQRKVMAATGLAGGTVLLAVLLGACAAQPGLSRPLAPLRGIATPPVELPDFQRLTPAMESFIERYVVTGHGRDKRAWSLAWAVTDRNLLDFRYNPELTLPPAETFSRRTGNCLSFSLMFVAMARHLGLDAWYQEVAVPPQWNSANNTLLVSIHINVVVEGERGAWVVDVSGETDARTRHLRRVGDDEAVAQYLNNLGAEALTSTDLGRAYAYFSKAIAMAPRLSYLWSNLGVLYNRNGQVEDARDAHLTALDLDPGNANAANNLFLLYEQEGDMEAARALQARVERHRRRNPYYLSLLSAQAIEEGRLADSVALLQQAIELNNQEYRFHYELARMLVRTGDIAAARVSLGRAMELAPPHALADNLSVDHLPPLAEQEAAHGRVTPAL